MKLILSRIGYAVVPAVFLVAAIHLFKIHAPIAGGVCIFAAFCSGKN